MVSAFGSLGPEPPDMASFKPEVRVTICFAPNRGSKRRGAVFVLCDAPAGVLVRQEVHMQDALAAAGTKHGRLLEQALVPHDVNSPLLQLFRQVIFDNPRCVRRAKPKAQAFIDLPRGLSGLCDAFHAACLSVSSSRPRGGSASPIPTRSKRIGQGRPSASDISSMLDRLSVVAA